MSTSKLTSKESYYFRVGALIADVGEAKYNYSTAIRLDIDNSNVVAPQSLTKVYYLMTANLSLAWIELSTKPRCK